MLIASEYLGNSIPIIAPALSDISKVKLWLLDDSMLYTETVNGSTIYNIINENVAKGSNLITDAYNGYNWIGRQYNHVSIKHAKDFITKGEKHTNTVEGFFSHLKRMIIGTYHQVNRKHLQSYCDEITCRFNTRKISINQRFDFILTNMENRLTYKTLIS